MKTAEIVDIIYDTLMNNKQHPQLDLSQVDEQFVNTNNAEISFSYMGKSVTIKISVL